MASINDVAKDAGVSIATVSYIINKTKPVSPEVEKRVMDSIEKLNYNASYIARSLRRKRTNIIGVVLQNIRNPFFPSLLAGLEEGARANNYTLTFLNSYNDIKTERNDMMTLSQMWVDGIIIDTCIEETKKASYVQHLKKMKDREGKRIPMVILERNIDNGGFNAISVNNFQSGYEATRHLIEKERRKILHLTFDFEWSMTIDRKYGYMRAMEEANLLDAVRVEKVMHNAEAGYCMMKQLLEEGYRPEGVFAANDQMAIGCIKAIQEAGCSIPDDIAVVGFDNIDAASFINPSLTTIDVPRYRMGHEAVSLLVQNIENNDLPYKDIILETKLIVRKSTDSKVSASWDFRDL